MDPKEILSSEDTLKQIDTITKRHFSDENELNECYLFILDRLKEDDCKRIRSFTGKSKASTYLHTLINRLAIDFRRSKYGRRRYPKMVSALGEWAEAVYKYVCWQKFSFDDAYDFLRVEGLFKGAYGAYLNAVEPLRQAPCPENPQFVSTDDMVKEAPCDEEDTSPLDALIDRLDRDKKAGAMTLIKEVSAQLSQEDQLLIRLVYGSDLSISKAAAAVSMEPRKAGKRLKKILLMFRERLLAQGIRVSV